MCWYDAYADIYAVDVFKYINVQRKKLASYGNKKNSYDHGTETMVGAEKKSARHSRACIL